MPEIKTTPLHSRHLALGGKMIGFAGYDMPVQYSGIKQEHEAVRTRAGLFDVSHMGNLIFRGRGAREFLNRAAVNNVEKLVPGQVQYSALCYPNGTVVDDILIYALSQDEYMVVVNAANREKDLQWLYSLKPEATEIEDAGNRLGILSLQGPRSENIASRLVEDDLQDFGYYQVRRGKVGGMHMVYSRTGYTGEDGFEFYPESSDAGALWDALLEAGAEHDILPIGLGARDTLRLEAGYSLYGHEISDQTNLLEAGLGWITDFEKGDFMGREALQAKREKGLERKLMGLEMLELAIPREGCVVAKEGQAGGVVTSGTLSPTLNKGIALAYLPVAWAASDAQVDVVIRGQAKPAHVGKRTFYRRVKVAG